MSTLQVWGLLYFCCKHCYGWISEPGKFWFTPTPWKCAWVLFAYTMFEFLDRTALTYKIRAFRLDPPPPQPWPTPCQKSLQVRGILCMLYSLPSNTLWHIISMTADVCTLCLDFETFNLVGTNGSGNDNEGDCIDTFAVTVTTLSGPKCF